MATQTLLFLAAVATMATCERDETRHLSPSSSSFTLGTPRSLVLAAPSMHPPAPPAPPPPVHPRAASGKKWLPLSQLPTSSVPSFAPLLLSRPSPPSSYLATHSSSFSSSSSFSPSSSSSLDKPSSFSNTPEAMNVFPHFSTSLPLSSSSTSNYVITQEQDNTTINNSTNDTSNDTTDALPEEPRRPHLAHTSTATHVHLGDTAKLDCLVLDAANESVSWLRREDDLLELLTWADNTYTNDNRFSVVQEAGEAWRLWRLEIRDANPGDQGDYRCQVATHPPLLLDTSLTVEVPVARVVDERGDQVEEKHYNSGSMIELKCIVEQVPFPHGPVTWRRGPTVLSFNTSRGGISVRGEPHWGFVRSRLYVARAQPTDSGRYSCCYANTTCDAVAVHVIAGENSAAMQHDATPETPSSSSSPASHPSHPHSLHLILVTCLLTCPVTWRAT
ncbi:basement membrane-specific heparan sulfate proteoglycan core protein-like [Eriocheir sinensis]|uniref:basement membrane-specific heparan sulfate proteoglycan core protein-like n=1 Tax=Eriocheir sinensis TaxID=95602 RepID=UPI0021CA2E2E|nr:basement membrane-specific heparan sulfate proteoglycan core protein-like [Eriocheir sinensis]